MTPAPTDRKRRPGAQRLPAFGRRVYLGGLLVASPALVALLAVAALDWPGAQRLWPLWVVAVALTAWLGSWHYRRTLYPLYTLASLLEALREGDYSLRGVQGGVLGGMIYDINALAYQMQRERLQFEESSRLLSKTLAALDSAVFAFDEDMRLRLLNPAGERLLRNESRNLFGLDASELGLDVLLGSPSARLVTHTFPDRSGRFEIRHTQLRSDGRSGRLLVVNDVGRFLREEERLAWQRLLRVLGHEVNNSLAPIRSMAETLAMLVVRDPLPEDWNEDFRVGLEVIGNRAGSLARFLSGYSQLARLPPPQKRTVDLAAVAEKAARLEQRLQVRLEHGAPLYVQADPDQLEQAFINLVRNAVEAALPTGGDVCVRWASDGAHAVLEVHDTGPGPPPSENLFVPFFTTKPGGSGIGLVLVQQIAEAHDGGVALTGRSDAPGAMARLWLPVGDPG